MPTFTIDSIPAVLTVQDLCRVLRVSRAQYYRMRDDGRFPIPPIVGLGDRKTLFSGAVVRAFLTGEYVPPRRRGRA